MKLDYENNLNEKILSLTKNEIYKNNLEMINMDNNLRLNEIDL